MQILICLVAAAAGANLQGYNLPTLRSPGLRHGNTRSPRGPGIPPAKGICHSTGFPPATGHTLPLGTHLSLATPMPPGNPCHWVPTCH